MLLHHKFPSDTYPVQSGNYHNQLLDNMNHRKLCYVVKKMPWFFSFRVRGRNCDKCKCHARTGSLMISTHVLLLPSSLFKVTDHDQKIGRNLNGFTKQWNSNECSTHHTPLPDLDRTYQAQGIEYWIEANLKFIHIVLNHFLNILQIVSPCHGIFGAQFVHRQP